jgi:hypothetical protein
LRRHAECPHGSAELPNSNNDSAKGNPIPPPDQTAESAAPGSARHFRIGPLNPVPPIRPNSEIRSTRSNRPTRKCLAHCQDPHTSDIPTWQEQCDTNTNPQHMNAPPVSTFIAVSSKHKLNRRNANCAQSIRGVFCTLKFVQSQICSSSDGMMLEQRRYRLSFFRIQASTTVPGLPLA